MGHTQIETRQTLNKRAIAKHKRRFLRFFPDSFEDQRYIEWERTYKWEAHRLFKQLLSREKFESLLGRSDHAEIARRALQVESRCNFLFSFEKMALRDGLRNNEGAVSFAEGLYELLYESGPLKERFIQWIVSLSRLPRTKSRVLSWPVVTFFPFIAQPQKYIILKPTAMRVAADELSFEFEYSPKPNYATYASLLELAELTRKAIEDLGPKDFHDIQSFLWTIGSAEYERLAEELGID
ncbi:MAG: hypothetical protein AB1589_45340 [Cyanobacteriota bacterium]